MERKLILAEGKNEYALLELLLNRNLLCFKREDLLFESIRHERQLSGATLNMIRQSISSGKLRIYRVGDKFSDALKIPNDCFIKEALIKPETKVLTTPELEILMLIKEGKLKDFLKEKSKLKPSEFYRRIHPDYSKKSKALVEYFEKMSNKEIVVLFKSYKRLRGKTHKTDELSLYDILSDEAKKIK